MTVIAPARREGLDELDAAQVVARRRGGAGPASCAPDELELALRWCVLHPATTQTGVAVWGDGGLPAGGAAAASATGPTHGRVSTVSRSPVSRDLTTRTDRDGP